MSKHATPTHKRKKLGKIKVPLGTKEELKAFRAFLLRRKIRKGDKRAKEFFSDIPSPRGSLYVMVYWSILASWPSVDAPV